MTETSTEERAEVIQPLPLINNFNVNPSRTHPWRLARALPSRRRSIATTSVTTQQQEIQQTTNDSHIERPQRRSVCVPHYLGLRQVIYFSNNFIC